MSEPSDFFGYGDKFEAMKLVKLIISDPINNGLKTPITIKGGDVIWHYKHELGIWKNNGIAHVNMQVIANLGKRSKPSYLNDVVSLTQVETYIRPEEFVEDPNLIVMKNGTFHLDTMKLDDHNWKDYAKVALPVTYDPAAKCPLFLKFLERVAPTYINFLQEWTGYHFLKDQRYQRFIILLGDGDNGKSTYLHILSSLLGPDNVASQSLYNLTTNRFAGAQLYTKLANIVADIGPNEIKHTGALKIATGEDRGSAERKHRDPFSFINYAKLSFSCNQLPTTPDETRAFYKRTIYLKFNVVIPVEEQDEELKNKLTTPEELSGIFNWALEGLRRAMERHRLDEPSTIDERRIEYRRLSDPVEAFANDMLLEEADEYEIKAFVYKIAAQFCRDNGFPPPSDAVFFKELKKHIYYQTGSRTINKKRVKVLLGVKLIESARPDRPARGTSITSVLPILREKYTPPMQVVLPVQESSEKMVMPDEKQHLITDAIDILKKNEGRMRQEDFFKELFKIGHHYIGASLKMRGDPRFRFMGLEVKYLGPSDENKTEVKKSD